MFIEHIDKSTSAISHGGERFEPDPVGRFDVPLELAERMVQSPGWSVSADQSVFEAVKKEAPKPQRARKASAKTEE